MVQLGLFDLDGRLQRLDELGDQLSLLNEAVRFEMFRPKLKAVLD